MSSIVEILVYIRLHEKNGKKTFSKIGFHSGDLSDWKVFIVGYQDTCSWKAKIRVLLCHRLSKFWFTSVYTRKTKKRRFQKSDSTPESFQIEKWLSLDRCSWKATPPKKNCKVCNFQQTWWQRPRNFVPCSLGHPLFMVSIQRRGQSKNSIDSEKWLRWESMSIKTAHTLRLVRLDPKNIWQNKMGQRTPRDVSKFSTYFGQNKVEQQSPSPPPKNLGWSRANGKTRHFPIIAAQLLSQSPSVDVCGRIQAGPRPAGDWSYPCCPGTQERPTFWTSFLRLTKDLSAQGKK